MITAAKIAHDTYNISIDSFLVNIADCKLAFLTSPRRWLVGYSSKKNDCFLTNIDHAREMTNTYNDA